MVLRTRRLDSANPTEQPTHTRRTSTTLRTGPIGAPRASEVKEVLVTLRTRLEAQLKDGDDHDPAMVRALHGNIRSQLEQISEALGRIDDGKYGTCAECLKPIEADRLVIRPYSTLCMGCQNRQDRAKGARSASIVP
ncbi:MAG TPA: TraR/DksA C4-type zinc finger protein [Chloroflexia bacterium]|jgi:hypothetical protein